MYNLVRVTVTALVLLFTALEGVECKGAVALLTRKLHVARVRNLHIYNYFWKQNPDLFDMVIFTEMATQQDKDALQAHTPFMPLRFIDVTSHFTDFLQVIPQYNQNGKWINNPICPNNRGSRAFSFGYKLMCLFWFKGFVQYLPREYDWMMRIDDDVHILSGFPVPMKYNPDSPVKVAGTKWIAWNTTVPMNTTDGFGAVQLGMNQFARDFVEEKHLLTKPHFTDPNSIYLAPYTNVMYVDMNWLRTNALIREYQYRVEQSTCIMVNRWGDMELWGYITGIAQIQPYLLPISYVHFSHHCVSTNQYVVPDPGNAHYISQVGLCDSGDLNDLKSTKRRDFNLPGAFIE